MTTYKKTPKIANNLSESKDPSSTNSIDNPTNAATSSVLNGEQPSPSSDKNSDINNLKNNMNGNDKNNENLMKQPCYTLNIINERHQPLTASVYQPESIELTQVKNAVMIAPATGIKRQFYDSFAKYLAKQGFGVITFDNEGIGDSLASTLAKCASTLAKCDASLVSWGRQDLPAVLDALQDEFPNAKYHLVGHSAGGQLIGLMHNHKKLASVVNVACSSGRIKNMKMPFKAKAILFMDGAITIGNILLGYAPSDKFGMGEPLPKNVAAQWRDWCNGAGYIKTAFGKTVINHFYDDITTPSLWLNFTDDDIANAKNVDDMTRVFTAMPIEKRMFKPKEFGLKSIGHMRYFSSKTYIKAPELWQMANDWILKQSADMT